MSDEIQWLSAGDRLPADSAVVLTLRASMGLVVVLTLQARAIGDVGDRADSGNDGSDIRRLGGRTSDPRLCAESQMTRVT